MTIEELRDWVREWTQPQPRDSILPVLDEAIRERDVLRKRIDDAPVVVARRYASGVVRVATELDCAYANKRARLVVEDE